MRIILSKAVKQEIHVMQAQKLEPVIRYQAPKKDSSTRLAVLFFLAIVAIAASLAGCGVINLY